MNQTSRYPIHSGFLERVLKGIGALSASGVANFLFHVIVVPFAISAWGADKYGEWIVLSGLVAFLRLSDLGFQTHVVNRLCAAYAHGDRRDFRRVLDSGLRIQLALGAVLLAFAGIVIWVIPLRELLDFRTTSGLDLRLATLFLTAELLFTVPMGIIAGVYRATGRLARGALVAAVQRLGLLVLTVVLVLNHSLFVSLAAGRLVLAIGLTLWILRDIHRLDPWIGEGPDIVDWRFGLSMIAPGLLFLLVPIADYVSTRVVTFIIQRSVSGAEVSRFVTHRTITNFPRMCGNFVALALWPELTALGALGDKVRLRRLHEIATERTVAGLGVAALAMVPLLPWVYPLWTNGKLALDPWAMGLLLLETVIWGAWHFSTTFLLALNRQHFVGLILLFGASVTAATALVLAPTLGTLGGAIAVLVGNLSVPAWLLPLIAARELDISSREFVRRILRPAAGVLLVPTLGELASLALVEDPVLRSVAGGGWALFAAVLLWRSLSASERRTLLRAGEILRGQ